MRPAWKSRRRRLERSGGREIAADPTKPVSQPLCRFLKLPHFLTNAAVQLGLTQQALQLPSDDHKPLHGVVVQLLGNPSALLFLGGGYALHDHAQAVLSFL